MPAENASNRTDAVRCIIIQGKFRQVGRKTAARALSGAGCGGALLTGEVGLSRFERETEARWRYAQPSPLMPGLAKATPPSTVTVEPTT